jgi:hypothetical protein
MASPFPPQLQIASDLHLETPLLGQGSYHNFSLDPKARYLCLLGDIGLVKDAGLFTFLRGLLEKTPNLIILYVMGNHEPYQMSIEQARRILQEFAASIAHEYPGSKRFIFLHRQRYNVNPSVTVLGCTLWTRIVPEQMSAVSKVLTDYHPSNGIRDWGPHEHLEEHEKDVKWLNAEVARLEQEEPEREIVVLTHHSPTVDPRANDPRHAGSDVRSGFVTDLSEELCWTSPQVRLWAFGHTHFSFSYREEETGKLVVANQKGYSGLGALGSGIGTGTSSFGTVVVEARRPVWELVEQSERVRVAPSRSVIPSSLTKPATGEIEKEKKILKSVKNAIPNWLRFHR